MWAKKTLGWPTVIGMSFIAAYGVILTHHAAEISGYYGIFGWKLNWVVGLPCWLLGCLLAERLPQDQKINIPQLPTAAKIWTWRAAVFAASVVALVLQFHQHSQRFHLGYSFTLDFFAVLVYFWLQKETHYCRFNRPFRWLEAAGAASYSLYLTHPIVIDYFLLHQRWASKSVAGWMCIMCEIIVAAMVFYLVVERPSHMAARSFRQQRTEKIAAKTSPAVTL
jgi:peptidoglycan/LPS O-acetylase OafA/YrhL